MWPYHRTLNILLAVLSCICNDISWENFFFNLRVKVNRFSFRSLNFKLKDKKTLSQN